VSTDNYFMGIDTTTCAWTERRVWWAHSKYPFRLVRSILEPFNGPSFIDNKYQYLQRIRHHQTQQLTCHRWTIYVSIVRECHTAYIYIMCKEISPLGPFDRITRSFRSFTIIDHYLVLNNVPLYQYELFRNCNRMTNNVFEGIVNRRTSAMLDSRFSTTP